jgi:hypothetical protein
MMTGARNIAKSRNLCVEPLSIALNQRIWVLPLYDKRREKPN